MGYTDDQSVKLYKDESGKILLAGVSTLQNGGSGFSLLRLQEEELGISKAIKNNINVYPNPFKDIITINHDYFSISKVTVYNVMGQAVKDVVTHSSSLNTDLSELKSGNYILKINTEKGTYYEKLIKL